MRTEGIGEEAKPMLNLEGGTGMPAKGEWECRLNNSMEVSKRQYLQDCNKFRIVRTSNVCVCVCK